MLKEAYGIRKIIIACGKTDLRRQNRKLRLVLEKAEKLCREAL